MLRHRVIPCLLLSNGGLVKTTRFSKPIYIGDPINAIRIFNEKEVDELMLLDINASKESKEPDYKLIEEIASECFMPLCYGGGIKNLNQAKRLFKIGVEKICLQTAVINDSSLITQITEQYGSQSVVVSIDIKRNWLGKSFLYKSSTKNICKKPWLLHIKDVIEAGAGEVLLNAVDKDGLMNGMDWELITEASENISVPLIAVGGVGSMEDLLKAVKNGASAIAVGAYFVFHGPHRAVLITYPKYHELELLFKEDSING